MKYINKNNGYSVSSYGWRGIIVLALALLVSFNFLLLGGGRAEAAGIPNDAQGVSATGKYHADNNNQLMVVTNTEEHAIAENWAFCLANGKKFPVMHLIDGEAVYDGEFTRHILKAKGGNPNNHDGKEPQNQFGDDLTTFIDKNHKFGSFVHQPTVGNPTGESAAVLIAKLVYVFYADPTGILESSGLANTLNARNDFWAVVQNEIWRWTDGANFRNDYRYHRQSQQWRSAFDKVQQVYAQVTIPDDFQLRGYWPEFLPGQAGYQAILTGRTVNLQPGTVKITKHWKGVPQGETKPEVWMQLQKDGKAVETKQLEDNGDNSVMEFTISDKTEIDKYTVVELKADKKTPWAHDGYSAGTVTKVKEGGKEKPGEFEVTNTKNPEQPQPGQPAKHKVKLSKKEVNKTEELPGASLKLFKGEAPIGDPVKEWTSGATAQTFSLQPGVYTMQEIQAPDGYEVAENVIFKVDHFGKVSIKGADDRFTEQNGTIVTMFDKKKPQTPDPDQPGGEDPAKPAKPANSSLKTTVSANGASASSSAALSMELDKAASVTVVDKVDYEGLLVGEPYTLTGRLMRIDGDQAREVAQAEKKFTPTAAAGTQAVTFSNVTIEPGATYVVFETATSDNEILFAGEDKPVKHTVTHEDKNDKAQTLIVTKKAPETPDPEKPTPDQPKPDQPGGDNPGGDNPGGDNPGGDTPGGKEPGNPGDSKPDQPGGDKPGNPSDDKPDQPGPGGNAPDGKEQDNPAGSKGSESGKAKPADPQIGLDKRTDRTLSNTGVSLYWPALLTAGLMAMAGAAMVSWKRKQR